MRLHRYAVTLGVGSLVPAASWLICPLMAGGTNKAEGLALVLTGEALSQTHNEEQIP